jgi:hypothetical protein
MAMESVVQGEANDREPSPTCVSAEAPKSDILQHFLIHGVMIIHTPPAFFLNVAFRLPKFFAVPGDFFMRNER